VHVTGEETEDLVAPLERSDVEPPGGDEVGDLLAVAGQPEEPVGFSDLDYRCPVLHARAVVELGGAVELFGARAVQARVILGVEVSGRLAGPPEGTHAGGVAGVAAGA
jgi:hypothetical protein